MHHKTLFTRRLLFVTGKGGVGKTTVAASIAVAAKERGMRVLLIEVGVTENLAQIFRKWIPVYDITEVEHDLHVLRLDPYLALQDYMSINLKFEWAAKKFLQTDVIRYLTQAAPGWRELITLGKIWKIEQQKRGKGSGKPAWDLLVVDAPATGHGISFLRVPQVILDTLKYGPVRHYTQEVQRLLLDPQRTLLNVVTLPEEMPINEAVEFYNAAKEQLLIPFGFVFVNMMPPKVLNAGQKKLADKLRGDKQALEIIDKRVPGGHKQLFAVADDQMERRRLADEHVESARARINAEFVELPFLFSDRIDRDALARLARTIFDATE
jgi:anion-transporting  ArsA/GET3 family ATPase